MLNGPLLSHLNQYFVTNNNIWETVSVNVYRLLLADYEHGKPLGKPRFDIKWQLHQQVTKNSSKIQ